MDQQLLNTVRDYFHFVTKFFEVIKLSATHIYHSALELSPESSIIRAHYHQWPFQVSKPRVVYGVPSSWSQPATINGNYGSYTWSPCGQSFSARTSTSVEVWDALTAEKHSSLQLTGSQAAEWDPSHHVPDILAYSPDGCSLAGCFGPAVTIWDMQTGGMVEEIECKAIGVTPKSLVWSMDGTIICAIFPAGAEWAVVMYDVTFGEEISINTFLSLTEPCLWPHKNTLLVMVMLGDGSQAIINILEVYPIFINHPVDSFSIKLNLYDKPPTISFSPSTYRISVLTNECSGPDTLFAFDIQNPKVLLEEKDYFTANCLSPDGSLLVASGMYDGDYIWKYTLEQGYILWRKLPFWGSPGNIPRGFQFSPTSLSMLISRVDSLEVQYLEGPASDHSVTNPPTQASHHYSEFSANGSYVVTAPQSGWIITITNLYKNSSQSISTGFAIRGLALTGNVLLVEGFYELAGWHITAEGMVDGVLDDGREEHDGRLWTKLVQQSFAQFWVEGRIGVIKVFEDLLYYDIETGEELDSVPFEVPLPSSSSWKCLYGHALGFAGKYSFSYHNFIEFDELPEEGPPVSIAWYEEGWIKYAEGDYQHRFWLPTHWRPGWDEAHWIDEVTTLWLNTESGLVIIKF